MERQKVMNLRDLRIGNQEGCENKKSHFLPLEKSCIIDWMCIFIEVLYD